MPTLAKIPDICSPRNAHPLLPDKGSLINAHPLFQIQVRVLSVVPTLFFYLIQVLPEILRHKPEGTQVGCHKAEGGKMQFLYGQKHHRGCNSYPIKQSPGGGDSYSINTVISRNN